MRLNKTGLYTTYLSSFVILLSGSVLLFNGCKQKPKRTFKPTGDTIADGKKLAEQYCTKCHQSVSPEMLTKDVWKYHTLPSMAHYLGLSTYGVDYYKKTPDTVGVPLDEWQIITAYFEKTAPAKLTPAKAPVPLANDWAGFSLKKPADTKDIY